MKHVLRCTGVSAWVVAMGVSLLIQTVLAEEPARQEQAIADVEEDGERVGSWLKNIGGSDFDLKVSGTLEVAYDDNVFRYSDADRGTFNKKGATRQTQFRHVSTIDDMVTIPSASLGIKRAFVKDHPTEFRFGATMHLYGSDTVKNYERYDVGLKQRVGKDSIVRIGYSHIPDFVVRNLFDTDQPSGAGYQLARYTKNTLRTSVWHRFTPVVRGRARYRVDFGDYNGFFNERDNTTNTWDLTGLFHFSDALVWRAYWSISHRNADASDDDAAVDPDTSYLENGLGTRFDVEVADRVTIQPFYNWAFRDYTTGNSSADDRLHRDREDVRQSLGIKTIYELSKESDLYFEWERRVNDTNISFATGVSGDTDVLGYDQDVFRFGVTFRM